VKSERAARQAKNASERPALTASTPALTSTRTLNTTTRTPQPASQASSAPASLTTIVNSTATDGYIVVKAGADEVARENLWTTRGFFRTRAAKPINVTKEFRPRMPTSNSGSSSNRSA